MRQNDQGAEPRKERHVVERANIDEAQVEAGLGHQANLHAPRRAHKEHLGRVAIDQLVSDRQRRNDVPAGAAAGNENAQVRQIYSFQVPGSNYDTVHSFVTK